MKNPILYYDGACPLCNKEIAFLKRRVKKQIDFFDVHAEVDIPSEQRPSKEALLRRLHLLTVSGDWLVGLDANVYVWSKTPYGMVFKPLRMWPLSIIADLIYTRWADRRYEKRYACGACKINE